MDKLSAVNHTNNIAFQNNSTKTKQNNVTQVNNTIVDNKNTQNGDVINIPLLNKKVKKSTAIIGSLAILGTILAGSFAIIKHKNHKPVNPTPQSDPIEQIVQKEIDTLKNSINELDNKAKKSVQEAENLVKSTFEAYKKGDEIRADGTPIRKIEDFGDSMTEYGQDGKTVTRKTKTILGVLDSIEEYIGNRKKVLQINNFNAQYTEYEKLNNNTWKPIKETVISGPYFIQANAPFSFNPERLIYHWEDNSQNMIIKHNGKIQSYHSSIKQVPMNTGKKEYLHLSLVGNAQKNIYFNENNGKNNISITPALYLLNNFKDADEINKAIKLIQSYNF